MPTEFLKVYYGWAQLNGIRKRRALSVMFENSKECRTDRGQRTLARCQQTFYVRNQDEEEMKMAAEENRIFTEYSMMVDGQPFDGDLEAVLQANFESDQYHSTVEEREAIRSALRNSFRKVYMNQ